MQQQVQNEVILVENQFGCTVKAIIRTDNGLEFILPKFYISTVLIINRVPSKVIDYSIPYALVYGAAPDLSDLRTFVACVSCPHIQITKQSLIRRAKGAYLLVTSLAQKARLC